MKFKDKLPEWVAILVSVVVLVVSIQQNRDATKEAARATEEAAKSH